MRVSVGSYVHVSAGTQYPWRPETLDASEDGVISSCGLPNMDAWNWIQVLCKSSIRSQPLGHLSRPKETFCSILILPEKIRLSCGVELNQGLYSALPLSSYL